MQSYQRFQHTGHTDFKGFSNAVTPPFPTSINGYHTAKMVLAQSSTKRPTFAFALESGYTLGSAQRIAHNGSHGETQGVLGEGGIITLGAFRTFTNIPGPGVRTAYFAALGSWPGGALEERRKPSGQRCAYACRCPEGVAAPLGCMIFFISDEIVACMTCSRNFFRFSRRSSLCCSCASCVSARSFSVLVFARKTTGDYFSRTPISARSWSRGLGFAIVLDLLF